MDLFNSLFKCDDLYTFKLVREKLLRLGFLELEEIKDHKYPTLISLNWNGQHYIGYKDIKTTYKICYYFEGNVPNLYKDIINANVLFRKDKLKKILE